MTESTLQKTVALTDLADVNPPRPRVVLAPSDEVSFIPMADVTEDGRWIGDQTRRYSEVRQGFTCFTEGDVLFAKITPCMENGKGCQATGLVNSVGFGSTEFHVLRSHPTADSRFVLQCSLYDGLRRKAKNSMIGSAGQQRVPASFFRTTFVPNLSKSEQAKVADILSAVTQAIELTEALIAKLDSMKRGLMQDLLSWGVGAEGRLRTDVTHPFKQSELGRIPRDWHVIRVRDMFQLRKEPGITGLPVMSVVMNAGLVPRASVERRVESKLSDERHAFVRKGDITYNMMRMWQGVLGRATTDCLVSPAYVVLKPKKCIESTFAEWLFRDERSIRKFRQHSRGVVDDRLRLYPQDLLPIKFAIPQSIEEQQEIAMRLDSLKAHLEIERQALNLLKRIRAGLGYDLVTGVRRVVGIANATNSKGVVAEC